ncbi:hypothetical protein ACJD0Z_02270 [Flavobacteriaceae bacterium M23B6Z8]
MIRKISGLGTPLKKEDQKKIKGGDYGCYEIRHALCWIGDEEPPCVICYWIGPDDLL